MQKSGLDIEYQPQPQPHGAGFDGAQLTQGAHRGARTFPGRAPSTPARRSESPRLKAAQELRPPPQPWSSTDMRDDDDDNNNRPEDQAIPELGPAEPPRPSTEEGDYPQDVRAFWAAHDDEVELQVRWKDGDDYLEKYHAYQAMVRERDPPR